ncbi:MAG: hypothetical protein ACF8CQ_16715, partial [Rhodopirellula sp. JB044]|uniref:hypothetical protein n=1 Tax=Rhodopirellula sp. JB044 TaxID=3342844 RepID=UPI003709D361
PKRCPTPFSPGASLDEAFGEFRYPEIWFDESETRRKQSALDFRVIRVFRGRKITHHYSRGITRRLSHDSTPLSSQER